MRAQLMCLTSGCVGGLLVLACGAVDGAGSKVAIAEDVSLRIYVEVGDCVDSDDNYLPDSMELFLEEATSNNWIVSSAWDNDCNYAQGAQSTEWRIAYIR